MNHTLFCERAPCLPDDILLTLSPSMWQRQQRNLFEHFQDLSHLHCCIPKLLSHNPRGLRRLFGRLAGTPKSTALPFLEILLDLLFSLNPEGTWLRAAGMEYLITQLNIFTLLPEWFHRRIEIKEWLLALADIPLPKRKPRISFAEWYLLPDIAPHVLVRNPKDKKDDHSPILGPISQPSTAKMEPAQQENKPEPARVAVAGAERIVMISLDVPAASFQYRKIATAKRDRILEDFRKPERNTRLRFARIDL